MKTPMIQILKQSLVPTLYALCLTAPASAGVVPASELQDNRLGGMVSNKETNEKLYLACVEKNETDVCIQYRFVAQIGSDVRVLGNQPIQTFEMSASEPFQGHALFEGKVINPTMKWTGEGFRAAYSGRQADYLAIDHANAVFAQVYPVVGLLGVGAVVHASTPFIDVARILILLPSESIKSITKSLRAHKLNNAFQSIFNSGLSQNSQTYELKTKRFSEFKNELTKLATAPTETK